MPVVVCPNGHRLQVGDRQIGQSIKCPSCQAVFAANAEDLSIAVGEPDKPASPAPAGSRDQSQPSYITSLINAFVGKPLLFVGLILAVLGRGCDATGMRSVSRTNAQYQQAKVAFQLEWEGKIAAGKQKVDKKVREINEFRDSQDKKGGGEEFFKRMGELDKERATLDKDLNKLYVDQSSAQSEKETGEWKPAREAALSASNHHRMWFYWNELLFIFGTVVLVLGVLTLAFTGQGAERWVAYIMIAILTFSIYVFGAAWIESMTSSGWRDPPPPIMRDR